MKSIKGVRPEALVGRHIDHQQTSWDIFYRAAVSYADMAASMDFLKPVVYHDIAAPRIREWMIEELSKSILAGRCNPERVSSRCPGDYRLPGVSGNAGLEFTSHRRGGPVTACRFPVETRPCQFSAPGNAGFPAPLAYAGKVERAILFEIEARDVNCPHHVHKRFSQTQVAPIIESLQARIVDLERQLAVWSETNNRVNVLDPDCWRRRMAVCPFSATLLAFGLD